MNPEFKMKLNIKWNDPEFLAKITSSSHYFAFIKGAEAAFSICELEKSYLINVLDDGTIVPVFPEEKISESGEKI